jgi:mRNA interferase MazF
LEIVRGAILLAAGPGEYSGKPRPFLVVQSDLFNEVHPSLSLCPITSILRGAPLYRVLLDAGGPTGLRHQSEVQIDKVQTLRRARVLEVIGHAPATAMALVDQNLRRWLEL